MRKLVKYGSVALMGGALMVTGIAPAYASSGGTIDSGGGNVNLRAGPSTSYPIVGTIAQGTAVSSDCIAYGISVTGPFGATNLWDEIGNSRWVSDAFVNTGTSLPIAMPCNTNPLGPGLASNVYTNVYDDGQCDSNDPGAGTNYGSRTWGNDWFSAYAVPIVCDPSNNLSVKYTYGNGPNPSGLDYATWGYYPGAYARCDIWVHIPKGSGPRPYTNQAEYKVFAARTRRANARSRRSGKRTCMHPPCASPDRRGLACHVNMSATSRGDSAPTSAGVTAPGRSPDAVALPDGDDRRPVPASSAPRARPLRRAPAA